MRACVGMCAGRAARPPPLDGEGEDHGIGRRYSAARRGYGHPASVYRQARDPAGIRAVSLHNRLPSSGRTVANM